MTKSWARRLESVPRNVWKGDHPWQGSGEPPRFLGQMVDGTHAAVRREAVIARRVAAGVVKPCFSNKQALL